MQRSRQGLLLIRWLILGAAGSSMFPIAGLTGNVFRFAFTGNLLIELIDDALQLLTAIQLLFVGFRHIASIEFWRPHRCGPVVIPYPRCALGNPANQIWSHLTPRYDARGRLRRREAQRDSDYRYQAQHNSCEIGCSNGPPEAL